MKGNAVDQREGRGGTQLKARLVVLVVIEKGQLVLLHGSSKGTLAPWHHERWMQGMMQGSHGTMPSVDERYGSR